MCLVVLLTVLWLNPRGSTPSPAIPSRPVRPCLAGLISIQCCWRRRAFGRAAATEARLAHTGQPLAVPLPKQVHPLGPLSSVADPGARMAHRGPALTGQQGGPPSVRCFPGFSGRFHVVLCEAKLLRSLVCSMPSLPVKAHLCVSVSPPLTDGGC